MRPARFTIVSIGLLIASLIVQADSIQQTRKLVLVSAARDPVMPLSMLEIRQLYLGLSITKVDTRLVALRNYSDQLLKQMFLQKVVFMSSKSYERQLLRRTFGTGSQRPRKFDNSAELIQALKRQRGAISIMWRSKVILIPGLRIVQDL